MRMTVIPIVTDVLERSPKAYKGDWKSWKSEDHPNLSRLTRILNSFAITRTPVKNHQLTLVKKFANSTIIIIIML